MSRVVVLGGGPAGLYAALLLARRHIPVTVVEREDHPGGLTAGTEIAGQQVDFGSHRLHPSIEPDILADLTSILGEDLQTRTRNGRIDFDGTWIKFPLSPSEMLTEVRAGTLAKLGAGAAKAVFTPNRDDSFADVVTTGLGKPMGELFYFPYARKIWGLPPDQLSGEQARRRISADSAWKLVRKTFGGGGTGGVFYYPRHGFGQIASGLAAAAAEAGAEMRLGESVTAITGERTDKTVATTLGEIDAGLVLSTVPLTLLTRLLSAPTWVGETTGSLKYRAMVLVYLTVPTAQWTPYDAHYFPSAGLRFTRVSEPKNYRDGADPADRTVLCVEIPCDAGDGTWSEGDQDLIDSVRKGLVGRGLPDPGNDGEVRRLPFAYPVYERGSEAAFETISRWLDNQPGVVTFGRQGLFAHDNTHHAMAMARDAVACISDDLHFDDQTWAAARERFARHVVED